MKIAMVSRPLADADLRLARQMGMTDVVSTVPGVTMAPEREQGPALAYEDLLEMRRRVEAAGLTLSVIEGYQLSDRITLGLPGRDEDLAKVCEYCQHGTGRYPDLLLQLHGSFQPAAYFRRRARSWWRPGHPVRCASAG